MVKKNGISMIETVKNGTDIIKMNWIVRKLEIIKEKKGEKVDEN